MIILSVVLPRVAVVLEDEKYVPQDIVSALT